MLGYDSLRKYRNKGGLQPRQEKKKRGQLTIELPVTKGEKKPEEQESASKADLCQESAKNTDISGRIQLRRGMGIEKQSGWKSRLRGQSWIDPTSPWASYFLSLLVYTMSYCVWYMAVSQ